MRILGIESSCDDTGVAIYDSKQGLLANYLYSQVDKHAKYGGVVPELASRDHTKKLLPLIQQMLDENNIPLNELDGIAYTKGPGLIGALLVGASFAKALAFGLSIPSLGVHHLEAHLLAPMLEKEKPAFPFLALLVSGGHTQLLYVEDLGLYTLLGETLDDAVGEAFDKTAKLLGFLYPGGPKIAKAAMKGEANIYHFPRPMTDRPGLDFSFSGLKTFALNTWLKSNKEEQDKANIALAFEQAVCDTLTIKCQRAIKQTQCSRLVVAGGVSANLALRNALNTLMEKTGGHAYYPRYAFCTDNGAMVAYLGYLRMIQGETDKDNAIIVNPRWPLSEKQ